MRRHPRVLVRSRGSLMAVVGLAISVLAADGLRARQTPYDLQALRGEIDTGFRPGRDDWQFPNDGSTLCYQVEGHGVGMLLTERWYYGAKPDGDAAHLYNRYNNNGADKTAIWEDDRTALRLVSVVQADLETIPAVVTPEVVAAKQTPKDVWRDVASAMLQTGEPQMLTALEVTGDNRQIVAAKYLLVYRISDAKLYVADPVYPGRERLPVELTLDGTFQPYVSKGKASDEQAAQYNTMMPLRIGPLTRERIPQRWQQFKAGGLGEKEFQPYTLMTENAVGARYRLADGDTFATPSVTVLARTQDLAFGLRVFRDGAWVNEDTDKPVTIELRPGRNVIGLKVSLPAVNGKWAWHDFKYVTLTSTACDFKITPARQYCVVGQRCPLPFAVSTQLPLDGLAIDWYADSALRRSDGPREMDYVAPSEEGPHYIKAALRSKETGRVVCEAEATANVQPKPAPVAAKEPPKAAETPPDKAVPLELGHGNPAFWAALHESDRISVTLELQGQWEGVYSDGERSQDVREYWRLDWPDNTVTGTSRPVWDGTAFVWSYSTESGSGEIRGTLSPTGSTILSLTARETHRIEENPKSALSRPGTHTWRVEARNIHLIGWNEEHYKYAAQAAYEAVKKDVGASVIKVEDTELQTYSKDPRGNRTGPVDHRTSLIAPDWSVGGGITVHFEKRQ